MHLQLVKSFMQDLHKMQIEVDQNNTPIQWNTAVKFLMARKFEARRALELYRSHEVSTSLPTFHLDSAQSYYCI